MRPLCQPWGLLSTNFAATFRQRSSRFRPTWTPGLRAGGSFCLPAGRGGTAVPIPSGLSRASEDACGRSGLRAGRLAGDQAIGRSGLRAIRLAGDQAGRLAGLRACCSQWEGNFSNSANFRSRLGPVSAPRARPPPGGSGRPVRPAGAPPWHPGGRGTALAGRYPSKQINDLLAGLRARRRGGVHINHRTRPIG